MFVGYYGPLSDNKYYPIANCTQVGVDDVLFKRSITITDRRDLERGVDFDEWVGTALGYFTV